MYRLLIVDDEAGHRAGLIGLLRILKPEYLVFEAENGAVALKMMDVVGFDLVLTDIRMPQVDGLAFLERSKALFPHVRVAILSAHGVFDYAKKSVSLGADDYLLKPVDADELRDCLNRMENQIASWRAMDRNGETAKRELFLFVTDGLSKAEHAQIRALFGGHRAGAVLHIRPVGEWQDAERREVFQYKLRLRLKQLGHAVVFRSPADHGVLIGIVACGRHALDELGDALRQERDAACAACGQDVIIGFCAYPEGFFEHLEDSYTRAKSAGMQHFFQPDQRIFSLEPELMLDPFSSARLDVSIKGLDASLCGGDVAQAYGLMAERIERLCAPGAYPSKIKEVIMYTFIFLLGNLNYPLSHRDKSEILSVIDRRVLECLCLRDMLTEIRRALQMIADAVEGSRKTQHESMFAQVLAYVSENYDQDLSMAGVAARFHYHPSYFSLLFKHNAGTTFREYLSEIRMREAARLLKESSLYAARIGAQVGYPSAAYFTKAFKKQFGMSPDEYRRRGGNGKC